MEKKMPNTLCVFKELYKQVVHLSNTWEKSVGLSLSSTVSVPLSDVGWRPYRAPKCCGVDIRLRMCGCLYFQWTLISHWHQWKLFATGLTASAFVLPLSAVGHPEWSFLQPNCGNQFYGLHAMCQCETDNPQIRFQKIWIHSLWEFPLSHSWWNSFSDIRLTILRLWHPQAPILCLDSWSEV